MNQIKIFNTLTDKKEVFEPIEAGHVGMYHCGPTVYDRAHVGNLRSYVFADILRRTFEYYGYEVRQVINITDVGHLSGDTDEGEDKMTKALKREGKELTLEAMREIGTKYFDAFTHDLESLCIEMPDEFPRASDNIDADIELIKRLESNGFVYQTKSGVYFDTSKFPNYGKLGNIDIANLREGARITTSKEKRNPTDFALWKSDDKLGWQSPWGKGFPGWHIECSAMASRFLGQPFDIHTGGIDHIPVHHNNEIAQSEAANGKPLANYWMHNAFLTIDDGRMGKSEGNAVTLDLLRSEGTSPLAYRYWLLTAHYRKPVDFSIDAVKSAQNALSRLEDMLGDMDEGGSVAGKYKDRFERAICDDLNTPEAIAIVWELTKDDSVSNADKRATILDFDRVLGLGLSAVNFSKGGIPAEIISLAEERNRARHAADWSKADTLRKEIESKGYSVKDTEQGSKIVLRAHSTLPNSRKSSRKLSSESTMP